MIPYTRPYLGHEEANSVSETVLSRWITQGPKVQEFEDAFAEAVGAPHAAAVSNCSTGLHLALLALDVGAGDEVVTVSHSFIATANVVRYCNAEPVFVDVDLENVNINPEGVRAAITDKTKAIICVHQLGMPCDMAALLDIAHSHNIPLVEDAACAIGSEIQLNGKWQRIGAPLGDIAVFSFHPRKVITTGEGGMMTTRNPELDRKFRLLRQHAMSVPASERHNSTKIIFEDYPVVGYNYRMSDIQAAVGIEQLKRMPDMVATRRRLADRYAELMAPFDGLEPPQEPAWARSNWQSYAVRLPEGCDQMTVMQRMLDDGVSTRRGVMCAHLEGAYDDHELHTPLPVSEMARDDRILLPMFHELSDEEQQQVIASLARACDLGDGH